MRFSKVRLGLMGVMMAVVAGGAVFLGDSPKAQACHVPSDCIGQLVLPDLRVTDLQIVTVAGQRFVRVQVRNTGTANAGPYVVALEAGNGAVVANLFDANGLVVNGTDFLYYLMPVCTPGALILASYEAHVDPSNLVAELNNGNNIREESWFFYC